MTRRDTPEVTDSMAKQTPSSVPQRTLPSSRYLLHEAALVMPSAAFEPQNHQHSTFRSYGTTLLIVSDKPYYG